MKRTGQQNRAIHKYLEMLTSALNAKQLTLRDVLTKPMDIPWNARTVRELLWNPIEDAVDGDQGETMRNLRIYLHSSLGVLHVGWREKRDEFIAGVAEALNDAGLEISSVFEDAPDIPWSDGLAKELLWRPVQRKRTGKESTTELDTREVDDIYRVIDRHMAQTHGISVPFPCEDERRIA